MYNLAEVAARAAEHHLNMRAILSTDQALMAAINTAASRCLDAVDTPLLLVDAAAVMDTAAAAASAATSLSGSSDCSCDPSDPGGLLHRDLCWRVLYANPAFLELAEACAGLGRGDVVGAQLQGLVKPHAAAASFWKALQVRGYVGGRQACS